MAEATAVRESYRSAVVIVFPRMMTLARAAAVATATTAETAVRQVNNNHERS